LRSRSYIEKAQFNRSSIFPFDEIENERRNSEKSIEPELFLSNAL
jgi:hypothetical protein